MNAWYSLPVVVGTILVLIILGIALVVLWKIFTDRIDLTHLITDTDASSGPAKASLSRFQFLIFTFVVAGLFLLLCIETGTFVEIPPSVLGLIGISGGSYVLAKGIGSNADVRKIQMQSEVVETVVEAEAVTEVAKARTPRGRRP